MPELVKNQTLQFLKKLLFLILCCFASSSILFSQPASFLKNGLKNKQLEIKLQALLISSQPELAQFLSTQQACTKALPACLKIKDIIISKKYYLNDKQQSLNNILEFPIVIDLDKLIQLSHLLKLSKAKQRLLIQQTSVKLNQLSLNYFLKKQQGTLQGNNLFVEGIAINNTLTISNNPHVIDFSKMRLNKTLGANDSSIIAILDSGVSTYHQQMMQIEVTQFNPLDNTFELKDTALGHASGILSLLAVKQNKEIQSGYIKNGKYLSCNGLPKGKYHYSLILKCMNWFFLQPKVDVIINAWLASTPGCKNEWQQPIKALLAANTIPLFSAGNYANNKQGKNFSPANLIIDNLSYPLVTVGALKQELQRLDNSSFGLSNCDNKSSFKHYQANIFSMGEKLKVAIPFAKNTYQIVSGTSYSIVKVAATIVDLKKQYPEKNIQNIVFAVLNSANKLNHLSPYSYGQLNSKNALKQLELSQ